jgi:3-methyladenine DNA glycosylase/8-oxoguanine DNA glycosylase
VGAAQTHVAKGVAMLSDAIEDKLEDVIDRVPCGSQVRPLIESTVHVALATALEALLQRRAHVFALEPSAAEVNGSAAPTLRIAAMTSRRVPPTSVRLRA